MNDKIIGIIGGMGPEATANLYYNLIKKTKIKKDQDHFRVIIDSNSKIPDRTEAILFNGESPVTEMVSAAKNLEKANVDVACITCITAHYFIDEIQKEVDYKILNAIDELNNYIKNEHKGIKKIGILSTSGTVKTEIFNKYLQGYDIIYPDKKIQENNVMEAIYGVEGIKNGINDNRNKELLLSAGESLIDRGAEVLIAGCTEIGLAICDSDFNVPLLDPMDVIVSKLIR